MSYTNGKDVRKYLLIIGLIIFLFTFCSFAEEINLKGTVIGDNVNIRDDSNLNAKVLDNLPLGSKVDILGSKNNWYKIRNLNGIEGWILNDFVLIEDSNYDPMKKGIVIVDSLNLREEPNLSSNIISTLPKSCYLYIVDSLDEWYKVYIDTDISGWVYSTYVEVIPNYSRGIITGQNVNLRKEPDLEGEIVDSLSLNLEVQIKNYSNDWFEIILADGKTGWVYKEYLKVNIDLIDTPVSRSSDRIISKIISFAKSLLGKPYKYGASGPSSFDCSGFTYYVFKNNGIELPRTSVSQSEIGKAVSKSELMPGDLVFFDTSGKIDGQVTHVGIYLGNGEFIHASSGKNAKKVVCSSLNEGYYKDRFVKARRIL